MANQVELFCDQGTSFSYALDLSRDDGTALNVAGYTFASSIRKSYYSSGVTANLTISIINESSGNIQLSMNAATTTNIKPGRYLYDVKMINDQNTTFRVIEGIITVYPQITK